MKAFELFAGCGGLAKGFELAGFSHAGFLEINHQACESLRRNFNPKLVHETDARSFKFAEYRGVELVTGGPPCQPFSLGGLANGCDDRRDMFPQAARAISDIHPKAFVFENVKGLLRTAFRPYFNYIINRLRFPDCVLCPNEGWPAHAARLELIGTGKMPYYGLRYKVDYHLFNAVDYGVPQYRERVFIVGLRSDVNVDWTWPEPTTAKCHLTIEDALSGVPDPRRSDNHISDHIFRDGARPYPGHTGSPVGQPSKTVKAGAHGVPGGENMLLLRDGTLRYMTVHEAKLIQTFPPDFEVTGSWTEALRQIGNAVPVQLARTVAVHLRRVLELDRRKKRIQDG